MMEKFEKDGKVAVLVSGGYGAGWYSWNKEIPQCLFDPEIVKAVIAEDKAKAQTIAERKWPDGYWGGSDGLYVEWLTPGTAFRINEYDGYESLIEFANDERIIA